jgi:hypothetical protein
MEGDHRAVFSSCWESAVPAPGVTSESKRSERRREGDRGGGGEGLTEQYCHDRIRHSRMLGEPERR